MQEIIQSVWAYLVGALTIVVTLIIGWRTAKRQGKSEAYTEHVLNESEQRIKFLRKMKDVEQKINALEDGPLRDYALKWLRDLSK